MAMKLCPDITKFHKHETQFLYTKNHGILAKISCNRKNTMLLIFIELNEYMMYDQS